MSRTAAVLVLVAGLLLLYALMWRGWRRRGRRHDLPPLPETRPGERPATLAADARYYGTTVAGDWLDRVVARGLGTRSAARLELSGAGLDVLRDPAFRIPAGAVRGARHASGHAGKVVPPHGLMVVTWAHGDLLLDSGFRLADGGRPAHEAWVAALTGLAAPQEESR